MIIVEKTVLSDDVAEQAFVCDLAKCKGACCVEGDSGAPLEDDELKIFEEIYDDVEPFLSEEGKREIQKQGLYLKDIEGDYTTPTIGGRECAYAVYDKHKMLQCGIELAWKAGKTHYRKPISCQLYPIRVTKYDQYDAINYHRWHICSAACDLGNKLQVPVYKFLKDALVRKYGADWYAKLEAEVDKKNRKQYE
tara:strand:+ start:46 stop:627 length:582 start_codon:yes stop_codon:yes gene_type:complete